MKTKMTVAVQTETEVAYLVCDRVEFFENFLSLMTNGKQTDTVGVADVVSIQVETISDKLAREGYTFEVAGC